MCKGPVPFPASTDEDCVSKATNKRQIQSGISESDFRILTCSPYRKLLGAGMSIHARSYLRDHVHSHGVASLGVESDVEIPASEANQELLQPCKPANNSSRCCEFLFHHYIKIATQRWAKFIFNCVYTSPLSLCVWKLLKYLSLISWLSNGYESSLNDRQWEGLVPRLSLLTCSCYWKLLGLLGNPRCSPARPWPRQPGRRTAASPQVLESCCRLRCDCWLHLPAGKCTNRGESEWGPMYI